jgi:2-(1,2-epoxy-1,2-dihydrophenyl)acetyl-CoA isomerase
MGEPAVELSVANGLATVRLNRPDRMNSLDREGKGALLSALQEAADAPDVRSVLLTATGRGFCVGQDLREFVADRENVSVADLFTTVRDHFNPLCQLVATMPKPVVAAIQGAAAGAGLSLALAADFRIAADTATFTTAFTAIGLSADTDMTWHLPRLVGTARALELLMLSPTLSAREACDVGMINRVVPADELAQAAREWAEKLACGPTLAYAAIKKLVRAADGAQLGDSLDAEYAAVASTGASADHDRAVRAFLNKQKPIFEGC